VLDYYRTDAGQRFLLRQATGLTLGALALLAVFGDGRLDLAVERSVFDAARHTFPLADQWLLKAVLHDDTRAISAAGALALLGVALASWVTPLPSVLRTFRRELSFAAATVLVSAAAVTVLKHFSAHACPWSLAVFGGTAPYHALLDLSKAPGGVVSGCTPAAHPLTGYAWLGVGLTLYPSRTAVRWWQWTFVLGSLFGLVQVLRGAHFVSHVLWSAWVVWAVDIALLGAWVSVSTRPQHPTSEATDLAGQRRPTRGNAGAASR
jgi:membrane-associated PAP2 superfamily phosphatase